MIVRHNSLLQVLLILLGALFPSAFAFAYCFPPNPSVPCEFLNSDAVFVGKVISVRAVPEGQFIDGWYYRLRIEETFRGPQVSLIEVYTANDTGRFPLKLGVEYLLFASRANNRLEIYNCGNSAILSKARDAIKVLATLRIPKDAEVEGHILPMDHATPPTSMNIVIHGNGRTYTAVTDHDGIFLLHLPPGKYSIQPQDISGWHIIPDQRTFDNPNGFVTHGGRCTALQFLVNSE